MADATKNSSDNGIFLALPAEIRIQVYGYLFISGQSISIDPQWTSPAHVLQLPYAIVHEGSAVCCDPLHPAIMSTYREILRETRPVLYGENEFHMETGVHGLETLYRQDGPLRIKLAAKALLSLYGAVDQDICLSNDAVSPTMASFQRRIGTTNASLIRRITICSKGGAQFSFDVVLAMLLCEHMSDLESLLLRLEIPWDEFAFQENDSSDSDSDCSEDENVKHFELQPLVGILRREIKNEEKNPLEILRAQIRMRDILTKLRGPTCNHGPSSLL